MLILLSHSFTQGFVFPSLNKTKTNTMTQDGIEVYVAFLFVVSLESLKMTRNSFSSLGVDLFKSESVSQRRQAWISLIPPHSFPRNSCYHGNRCGKTQPRQLVGGLRKKCVGAFSSEKESIFTVRFQLFSHHVLR